MEREQKEEGIVRSDLCIPVHHDTDTDFVDYFFPGGPEDDTVLFVWREDRRAGGGGISLR